jgi:hypothetical protein
MGELRLPFFIVSFQTVIPAKAGIHIEAQKPVRRKLSIVFDRATSVAQHGFPLSRERRAADVK